MNYTQAQIDRANAVSLEDFLRTQGETLKIIAVLCVSDIHAVCTPFIGSLCGKLLTGTNTPFAMSCTFLYLGRRI